MRTKTVRALGVAIGAVLVFAGCAKSDGAASSSRGQQLFVANCSQCHGATGVEGGIGPSLRGERARKNAAQTAAWIENPQPPMPKLAPAPLGEKDVTDIAAYVTSL